MPLNVFSFIYLIHIQFRSVQSEIVRHSEHSFFVSWKSVVSRFIFANLHWMATHTHRICENIFHGETRRYGENRKKMKRGANKRYNTKSNSFVIVRIDIRREQVRPNVNDKRKKEKGERIHENNNNNKNYQPSQYSLRPGWNSICNLLHRSP